jgi:hypothetical protein
MGCLRDHSAAKDTDSNRVSGLFHAFSTSVWQTNETRNSFVFVSSNIRFVLYEIKFKKRFGCVSICAGKSQIFAIFLIKIHGSSAAMPAMRLAAVGTIESNRNGIFSFNHEKLE